ncbi:MAG: DciA family protein, partial [Alphaproteobacteria bacterium]
MTREGRSGNGGRKAEPPRRERPTVAAALMAAVLDAPTRRQGFTDHRLLTDWASIVGPDLARDTVPMKLDRRSRALTLKVRPSAALAVQHEEPRLLERINAFFGTTVAHR